MPLAIDELLNPEAGALPAESDAAPPAAAEPACVELVLFGAGTLGRFTLQALRGAGIEPLAFADNNQRLWGTTVEGLPVLSAPAAAERFGPEATFVVTVYTGSRVRRQLHDLGLRVLAFARLFLRHADLFIPHCCLDHPHKMRRQEDAIRAGYDVWHDDASRKEYLNQVRYRLTLAEDLPAGLSPDTIYFPDDLVCLRPDEVFVDCGAFDGDSVRSFLKRSGPAFGHLYALEPDPVNQARLRDFLAALPGPMQPRITLLPFAAGARREILRFAATGTVGSSVTNAGGSEVSCILLDDLCRGPVPTYVKMDIEGAEPEALAGARELIRGHQPVLAISLYHSQEHLWTIPLFLRSLCPDYRLFLRRYSDDCWEQVCYAIPRGRLLS
jgi:FkbM family methyltransferase